MLAGITPATVSQIPPNTVFAAVTDQHWVLCIKGIHKTLVFDSLGLPVSALKHVCQGVDIVPWNKEGYQSMYSSVCGYYIVAVLLALQQGSLVTNGNVDSVFEHICPYNVPRPPTMSEWFAWHRTHSKELHENDKAVVEYVDQVYPNLGWLDINLPHLGQLAGDRGSTGMLGSPIYAHAGIHAPTVAQAFKAVNKFRNAADPQRGAIGNMTSALQAGPIRYVNENQLAYETATNELVEEQEARSAARKTRMPRSLHVAGPLDGKRLTPKEKVLYSRARLNAFNPPAGNNTQGIQPNGAPVNETV